MARRLIDCVGKAVKAGRLNQQEAGMLLARTERFAHLTKERAEFEAANSALTEQMAELSNLEKQVGPAGEAKVVLKTKDEATAMAAMFHEAQVVTENKLLAKQRETEGEGAILTQSKQAAEKELKQDISKIGGAGTAIVENLYKTLFEKLSKGDLTELGKPSKILQEAYPVFQAGKIKSPEDLKNWVNTESSLAPSAPTPTPSPTATTPAAAPAAAPTGRQQAVEKEIEAISKPAGERLTIYQTIKEKLSNLIARHAAEIQKLEFKAGLTIGTSEGLTAEEIAAQEIDRAKLGEIDKAKLLAALGELDTLLKFLPAEVRGRVGGFYQLAKGTMGEKTLTEFFTKRIRMVERAFEQVLVKEYRDELAKLFSATKPKKGENRIRKSTLGPDVQDEVDLARKASMMTAQETSAKLDEIDKALEAEDLLPEQRADLLEEWAIVNAFGDLDHRNAEDLASAYEWLSETVKTGRSQWRAQEEARRAENQKRVEATMSGLTKSTSGGRAKLESSTLSSFLKQFVLTHYSFQQFLDKVLPESSAFKKEWADRARRADAQTQDEMIAAGNRMTKALQGVVGNGRVTMAAAMWELKKVHANAVKKKDGPVPMSRLHAIQYLLSWAQPDVREKMINDGWTQENADQMAALTADPQSQAVMGFLRKEYAAMYARMNPIYRRMFGMNMPRIENYAPTYFENSEADTDLSPFGSPMSASGLTPGSLKARVRHAAPIRHVDALTAYWQHVGQTFHWANYAELLREMRGVLGNQDVRLAIKETHGSPVSQSVSNWIDALSRQGMTRAADIGWMTRVLDGLVGAKAVSTLGLNFRSVLMQMDSMLRATATLPMKRVIAAMADRNFINNVERAWYSPTIQRRLMSGGTPEARYLFDRTQFKPSVMLELARLSMFPMQWSDARLTSFTAAVVYTDAYNESIKGGATPEQAEAIASDAMDEAVYRYSQPVGLASKSLLEVGGAGGPIRKMFMLFMSDARLKTSLMLESFQGLITGKGKVSDHLRRIAAVEVWALGSLLLQNIYRDLFSDDEDEEIWTLSGLIRAMVLAPLSGLFMVGTVFDIGITRLIGEKAYEPSRDPGVDAINRVTKAFDHFEDLFDTDDPGAMLREWEHIARGTALAGAFLGPMGAAPGVVMSTMINFLKPLVGAIENAQEKE